MLVADPVPAALRRSSIVCPVCGLLYLRGDKTDESNHRRFHNRFFNGPPIPRLKSLATLQEADRTIVYVNQSSPQPAQALVCAAVERAASDLGEALPLPSHWKCYFVQQGRTAAGFALVQNAVVAYLQADPARKIPCPIGVLRLWVAATHRLRGIATAAVDAARHNEPGMIPRCRVAFSEPTDAGLAFATKYCGTAPFVFDIDV
jgi:N-acetyltransferase